MRLGKAGGVGEAAALIAHAREIGVTSVHCSSEYDSFALFVDAWRASAPGAAATVIAKVAAPHYGEDRFDAAVFRAKVEAYLTALRVDRIIVQWLLRYDLKQEDARLRILHDGAAEIAAVVAAMKAEGKIAGFVGFPYTMPIAQPLADADWCDGLALYVNALEHDTDAGVEACARTGKPVIAIRPYAAGRVFAETDLRNAHMIAKRLSSVMKHTMHGPKRDPRNDPNLTLAVLLPTDTAKSILARLYGEAAQREAS